MSPLPSRRRFLQLATLLGAGPALGLHGCMSRTRLSEVAVLDRTWMDTARQRSVPARLYLPVPSPASPLPLVLFSHGIGGSREGYSYLASFLASQGIICLHVQHVGSDRRLWWEGAPFSVVDRLKLAADEREARARVDDMRFALDQAASSEFSALIDRRRIVAAGHSYGANTALLLGGARVERGGRVLDLGDERISAIMLISAPPFYGESSMLQILSPVRVPSLHVTSTQDIIRIPGYYSDLSDRLAIYAMIGSERKSLAVFEGGSHSVFTDRNLTGGLQRNGELKRATRELALAFLRETFDREVGAFESWRLRHQALLAHAELRPS